MHPFVQVLFALCCVVFLRYNSDVVKEIAFVVLLVGIVVFTGGVIYLLCETMRELPKKLRYARIQREWERKFGGHDYK